MIVCVAALWPAVSQAGRLAADEFLPPLAAGRGWQLAWADEFDGKTIDASKWEVLGDWQRRDGYWVRDDSYLDGEGHLILRTKKDGDRYTCGAVRTKGRFEHRYGYWVCRCKFPEQPGHWPAFWLMADGVSKTGDGGRDGTEIDIMEKPWREDRTTQNLHWDGYGKEHQSAGTRFSVPGMSEGFHTFGLLWTPQEYVFYVNGQETWRTSAGGVSQVPQFAKLTEEIGTWGGDIKQATLPDSFVVDYVRVYDVVDQAGSAQDYRKKALITQAANVRPSPQQIAWQQLEFIGFIHYTVNAFTDKEWGEGTEDPKIFNPTQLDVRQWVRTCKDAGMRMVILTAKHHDGFCLWPSKYTEHSVKNSPWRGGKGDVVREAADACRAVGIKFGVYLSPWDRHEKTYGSDAYNEHYKNQLRELLTNYGPITEVWWDGACGEGPNGKRQVYDWSGYTQVVRELQPQAVIFGMGPDVRWVGNESGLARESEWSVLPKKGPGDRTGKDLGHRKYLADAAEFEWYPAECDVSIRPGWFYHAAQDEKVKTLSHMLDIYYSSVGRNSVLLLNIPPDRRGLFHENDVARIRELRNVLDATYKTNLALGAKVTAAGDPAHSAQLAVDGDPATGWAAAEGPTSASLEIDLGQPRTFDRLLLQEQIRTGQRVEQFTLEAWDGQAWKAIAAATTIGYKRLLRLPETTAAKIRLTIVDSRDAPTIAEIQLFQACPEEVAATRVKK